MDVASHIVSDDRLGEPRTNRELFTLLERADWISHGLVKTLAELVGLRNILVRGYEVVDRSIVREVVKRRRGDLTAFVGAIRKRLGGPPKP